MYAEDRNDVYTGDESATGSTGSSGTPSPSFFPVKPHQKNNRHRYHEEKEREYKERIGERERMETPTISHKNLESKFEW